MIFIKQTKKKLFKMKTIYLVNLVCLFILTVLTGYSQSGYHQIIDTAELSRAELINLYGINSEYLELSPAIYGSGIVYMSSMPVSKIKKFDKENDQYCFSLIYAQLSDSGMVSSNKAYLSDLKIKDHEGPCAFTVDYNTMFISLNSRNTIERKNEVSDIAPFGIYIYKNQNGFWIYDSELPVNSYGYKVFHPTWDEAGQRLIFASDMPGGFGETDLYSIRKTENGWIDLKNLGPEINTKYKEAFPFIYRSHFLMFASNKPGGSGAYDIYFSSEASQQFQKSINLGNKFNTEYDDFGMVIPENPGICYFSSNRPGGKGKDDIYMIKSEGPVFRIFNDYYTLLSRDSKNGEPLNDVKITFSQYELKKNDKPRLSKFRGTDKEIIYTIDTSTIKVSKAFFTDKTGKYNLVLPEGNYIISAQKSGYLPYSGLFETNLNDKLIQIDLSTEILDTFNFSFLNGESNETISEVSFEIIEGKAAEIGKSNDNIYFISVTRGNTVKLRTNEKEYLTKEIQIDKAITPSVFDIVLNKKPNYVKNLPTSEGETFILRDILYDYNSFALNDKSKYELDKLVMHLKKHPEIKIELSSHTDSRGNDQFNTTLSEKRSEAAKKYLIRGGVARKQILAKGYGEKKLKNHCTDSVTCSEAEHAENRRTEVKVIK
jgi:outer membrane protein OmpA-like peptidoglycan-associated protein